MTTQLIHKIKSLKTQKPLWILGSAIVDIVSQVPKLPLSGEDILLNDVDKHIGGCAFNIAMMLKQFNIDSHNALPIGQGIWASEILHQMKNKGVESSLMGLNGDNGWCLALVEPSGERTFLTVDGIDSQWEPSWLSSLKIENDSLIYLSGYQLDDLNSSVIIDWLHALDIHFNLFIDFGPRITSIKPEMIKELLSFKPIVSLNQLEAEHLGLALEPHSVELSLNHFAKNWFNDYQTPLVIRLGELGAYVYHQTESIWLKAFPTRVIDTIGAGDYHSAGTLAGLAAGWDLSDSVQLGNAVAAYIVSQRGADNPPSRDDLIHHIKHYGG